MENAFVQTSALGNGLNLKFGRFFSGLGYLNDQHSHVWDFVDQPLVYRVLWDNQLAEDGMQLKWLAPTDMFIEVGGEVGAVSISPARTGRRTAPAQGFCSRISVTISASNNSWRAGISLHQTRRENAVSNAVPDSFGIPISDVTNSFTGDSRTAGLDFVWKYSPNGNIRERYLKVQSEYFQRKENGLLTRHACAN